MAQPTGQLEGVSHHCRQIPMRLEFEDLGADVGMEAGELGPGFADQLTQDRLQLIGVEAEFAVQVTGLDVLVGVALDAGGEAQHQPGRRTAGGHQFGQALEIVLVVDNDRDVVVVSEQKLVIAFVVAMQHHPFAGHPPSERRQEFAGGDRIQAEALGGGNAAHQQGTVGLGGVDRQRGPGVVLLQGVPIGTAGATHRFLIQHVQRCAVTLGELTQHAPPHHQSITLIQASGDRRQIAVGTGRVSFSFERLLAGDGLGHVGPAKRGNVGIELTPAGSG